MERFSIDYTLSEEQKKMKQKQVDMLLKHPFIKAWQKKYQVNEAFIYNHSGRFQDWCKVKEACEHCAGLSFCRQPMKGQYLDLYLDGMLMNIVRSCPYRLDKDKDFAHERFYRVRDMADEYLLVDLATIDLNNERLEYKAAVMQVLQCIMDEQHEKGIFLWGKPGAGKSWLAAGMSNYFARKKKSVAFVNVPKLMADLKRMFHDSDTMERKLNHIKHVEVLVLDDIGGESITAWSRDDILLPLLDARMEKRKLTVFTSNYNQQELKSRMALTSNRQQEPVAAERLAERIKTLSKEVFIKGDSRRQ